jgi:hypothetical protein
MVQSIIASRRFVVFTIHSYKTETSNQYIPPSHPNLAYPTPLTWQYTTNLARASPSGQLQTNENSLQAAVRGKGADAAPKQNKMPSMKQVNKQSTPSCLSNASVRPGYHNQLNAAQM